MILRKKQFSQNFISILSYDSQKFDDIIMYGTDWLCRNQYVLYGCLGDIYTIKTTHCVSGLRPIS